MSFPLDTTQHAMRVRLTWKECGWILGNEAVRVLHLDRDSDCQRAYYVGLLTWAGDEGGLLSRSLKDSYDTPRAAQGTSMAGSTELQIVTKLHTQWNRPKVSKCTP